MHASGSPTTPAAPPPNGPFQSPVEAAGDMKRLAKARAGLMSPEERQELYGLVAATMEALTRDEATKQKKADDRASEHAAKKRRAEKAAVPDAGARASRAAASSAAYPTSWRPKRLLFYEQRSSAGWRRSSAFIAPAAPRSCGRA